MRDEQGGSEGASTTCRCAALSGACLEQQRPRPVPPPGGWFLCCAARLPRRTQQAGAAAAGVCVIVSAACPPMCLAEGDLLAGQADSVKEYAEFVSQVSRWA